MSTSRMRSICRRMSSSKGGMFVFDRELKKRQRHWAFGQSNSNEYDYLRHECADRIADRIQDITKKFPSVLELGCHKGHVYDSIIKNSHKDYIIGGIEKYLQCDSIEDIVIGNKSKQGNGSLIQLQHQLLDHEKPLPFKEEQFDLVLSSLDIHWINDIPSLLQSIHKVLKPDGAFIGCMLGGNTLQELRYSFYLAEQERKGGLSPHASPFSLASDIAALMQGAGYNLPTIDVDTITVGYPDVFSLMDHIGRMGEGHAALSRHLSVGKDTMLSMASIYQELYGLEDGTIPATFQVIYVIGWKYHQDQSKPCKRGSAPKGLANKSPA